MRHPKTTLGDVFQEQLAGQVAVLEARLTALADTANRLTYTAPNTPVTDIRRQVGTSAETDIRNFLETVSALLRALNGRLDLLLLLASGRSSRAIHLRARLKLLKKRLEALASGDWLFQITPKESLAAQAEELSKLVSDARASLSETTAHSGQATWTLPVPQLAPSDTLLPVLLLLVYVLETFHARLTRDN